MTSPTATDPAKTLEVDYGNLILPVPALPSVVCSQPTLLAPPAITGSGRALQTSLHNGSGRALNDTPLGSTPSTASNSPRL